MFSDKLYVSTAAFKQKQLSSLIQECAIHEINRLELSSGVEYSADLIDTLRLNSKNFRPRFLLHNYFPLPKTHFVLNLASNDKGVLINSRNHCKNAIKLCAELDIPFYSVHSGFCFHANPEDLGKNQTKLKRIPMEEAEEIFVESLKLLCEYAATYSVDIAIENNVLAPFNLINLRNELFLGVRSEELLCYREKVGTDTLFLLLDVGHLKVSATTLNFDPTQFVREIAPFVKAVHLSDNDGQMDSNQIVTRDSWFWPSLLEYLPLIAFYILEAHDLSLTEIMDQLRLISEKINVAEE